MRSLGPQADGRLVFLWSSGTKDPAWRRCVWLTHFSPHQDYRLPPPGRFLRKNPGPVLPRLAEEPGSHDGQELTRSWTLGIRGLGVSHTWQRPDRNTGRWVGTRHVSASSKRRQRHFLPSGVHQQVRREDQSRRRSSRKKHSAWGAGGAGGFAKGSVGSSPPAPPTPGELAIPRLKQHCVTFTLAYVQDFPGSSLC